MVDYRNASVFGVNPRGRFDSRRKYKYYVFILYREFIVRGTTYRTTNADWRGVSSVIGIMLLLGIVAIASTSILLIGIDLIETTEQNTEME